MMRALRPTASIHPAAIVDDGAVLGEGVVVGAFAVVGPAVRLGDGCILHPHAMVVGHTSLGAGNVVHSFAVLGGAAQDKRAEGAPSGLVVGPGNVFREHVTVHEGTRGTPTRIGERCLLMVSCHVGHDVVLGDEVTVSNAVLLAGHVVVEDHATLGGAAAVAQKVTVGESAFVAGGAMVERDVPPFVVVQGDRARVRALNKVGLRRRGFDEAVIARLEAALRRIRFGKGTLAERAAPLLGDSDPRVARLAVALAGAAPTSRGR